MKASFLIKGRKVFLFAAFLFLIPGCATLPPTVEHELVPPGSGTATWGGIRDSGVAEDATFIPIIAKATPVGKSNFFPPTTKQVTWWALFNPYALGTFHMTAPNLVARWYAPNGAMYWEDNFPTDMGAMFAKNSLPIAGTPAEGFPGFWYVQIYREGSLIDEKRFAIDSRDRSSQPS